MDRNDPDGPLVFAGSASPRLTKGHRRQGARRHDERATVTDIIGEVAGRNAVLVDDFTISAGTLVEAAESLVARGASSVMAAVTHGVFAEGSMQRLDASPIRRLIVTDTVET